jgi:hypothetical protein
VHGTASSADGIEITRSQLCFSTKGLLSADVHDSPRLLVKQNILHSSTQATKAIGRNFDHALDMLIPLLSFSRELSSGHRNAVPITSIECRVTVLT